MQPNFLIIGAAKSGTTSLYALLDQHPDVFMSPIKEPSFFSLDENYGKGWAWYEKLFRQARCEVAIGEASVSYSITGIFPNTVERIARDLPQVKLIYIARNPVKAAESYWMETQRHDMHQYPKLSFGQFVRTFQPCLDSRLYWKQLSTYRERFNDEQILPLIFEEFVAEPGSTLRTVFEFLGVDPNWPVRDASRHHRPSGKYLGDGRILAIARRLPGGGGHFLQTTLPKRFQAHLRSVLKKEGTIQRPEWGPGMREWFLEQIADDSHQYLQFTRKPSDYWGF